MTTSIGGTVRIGAVNYLNSKPLIEGLAELLPEAELTLDYPSRLADDLQAGRLDVALVPSIEVLRHPNYEVVSDACVATRGPVMSVKMYSRVPFGMIRTLALDAGSRTSAALVRIMLRERFGVTPRLEPFPLDQSPGSTSDRCLSDDRRPGHARARGAVRRDAGTWAKNGCGGAVCRLCLPFGRPARGPNLRLDRGSAGPARDRGSRSGRPQSPSAKRPLLGLSEATAYNYLTKNLHFRLGSAERSGLRLFSRLAARLELAPEGVDLVFRDCATA